MDQWASQGLNVSAYTLIFRSQTGDTPTTADALTWKQNFDITSAHVVADPNRSFVPGTSGFPPQISVIDPRNMEVILFQEGWTGSYPPQLEQLAQQNQSN